MSYRFHTFRDYSFSSLYPVESKTTLINTKRQYVHFKHNDSGIFTCKIPSFSIIKVGPSVRQFEWVAHFVDSDMLGLHFT